MISVLIASIGRESLLETLRSVAAARVPEGQSVEIVIADDSKDGKVAALLAGEAFSLQLRVIPVGAGNVAVARNAALDAAIGDYLIFVDDDEIVEPAWLEGHVSAAEDFSADAVFGPVFPIYPDGTPGWFVKADPLFVDSGWDDDGSVIPHGRTGNTLVRRSALGDLRFDPAFGRSGGEDYDLFRRFRDGGARMVVTSRARVHEYVPPHRARMAYVWQRARRGGQIYSWAQLKDGNWRVRLALIAEGACKTVLFGLVGLVLVPFDLGRAIGWGKRAVANYGKFTAACGEALPPGWT